MSTVDLQPSKLGTREHWDKVYEEELSNFEELGDEGEIWFGIESVEKMVEWAEENVPSSSKPTILEIGSGNGTLLFALADAGYPTNRLAGIDYSPDAVKLAKNISATRDADTVAFSVCDFLTEVPATLPGMDSLWDVLLDKGTYDAIALGAKGEDGLSPAAKYPERAGKLLKTGGFFLITSCNFTEEELTIAFTAPETGLKYHSRVQHPTFTFGGRSGSICSTLAFQKV